MGTVPTSEQARAVHRLLREQRTEAVARGSIPTRAEQLATAERIGDSTTEPAGVTYDGVVAGGVPAQWVTPDGADPGRVLLYFHGGGYCFCSMHSHRKLVGHLAKAARGRAVNVDYRLAPEHPHPAALTDALAAYRWLLGTGVEPGNVVVAGDSAGGGIALALLVQARDEGVPLPAAAVLCSPWVDLAMTADSITTRAEVDVRQDPAGTKWCARLFLAGRDPRDPSASPLYADLAGLPPLYIQAGDWDILVDDAHRLAARARRCGCRRPPRPVPRDAARAPDLGRQHARSRRRRRPHRRVRRATFRTHTGGSRPRHRGGNVTHSSAFPGVGVLYRATDEMRFLDLARVADERGFTSLVLGEHTHIPVSSDPRNFPGAGDHIPRTYPRLLDPYVALSFVAAQTRLRIATCTSLPAQHDPIALAKALATLDFSRAGASPSASGTAGTPTSSSTTGASGSTAGPSCASTSS